MALTEHQMRMPEDFIREGESLPLAKRRWENTVKEINRYLTQNVLDKDDPKTWPKFFTLQNVIKNGKKYTDNWKPEINEAIGEYSIKEGINTLYEGNEFNPYAIARALHEANKNGSDLLFYASANDTTPHIITQRTAAEIENDIDKSNLSIGKKPWVYETVDEPWIFTQWLYDKFGWFKDRVEPYYREQGLHRAQMSMENSRNMKIAADIMAEKEAKNNAKAEASGNIPGDEDIEAVYGEDYIKTLKDVPFGDKAYNTAKANFANNEKEINQEELILANQKRYFGTTPNAHPGHNKDVQDALNNLVIEMPDGITEDEFVLGAMCAYSSKEVSDMHNNFTLSSGDLQVNPEFVGTRDEDTGIKIQALSNDILDKAKQSRAHIKFDDLLTMEKVTSPGRTAIGNMLCINTARRNAARAWDKFADGDSTEIVGILKDALHYHTGNIQNEPDITGANWVNNALILNQIADTLKKHPQLLEEMKKDPVAKSDLSKIVASNNILDVIRDGRDARNQLMVNKTLSKDQREDYAKKYLAMRILEEANHTDFDKFGETPEMNKAKAYAMTGKTTALSEAISPTRPFIDEFSEMSTKNGAQAMKQELYNRAEKLDLYKDIVKTGKPLFGLEKLDITNKIRDARIEREGGNFNRYTDAPKAEPVGRSQNQKKSDEVFLHL